MTKEKKMFPIAIFLSAIVLGVSYYAVQVNKQKSIEKQQLIKIEINFFTNPMLQVLLLGTTVIIGTLSGIYPALQGLCH